MSIYLLNRGSVPFGAMLAGFLAEHIGGPESMRVMSLSALAILGVVVATRPQILRLAIPFANREDSAVIEERVVAAEPEEAPPADLTPEPAAAVLTVEPRGVRSRS